MNRNRVLLPVILSVLGGVAIGSGALYFVVRSSNAPADSEAAARSASDGPASAQTGPIQECDALAAHPQDPDAAAAGIEDEVLDVDAVIAACKSAIDADPDTPRLKFQLARGYLAAGRIEDAAKQLVAAGEGGHGGALAYLADLHMDGAPGIEADADLAVTLYEQAADAGFGPAAAVLAEIEEASDPPQAQADAVVAQSAPPAPKPAVAVKYLNPEIVDNIMRGDLDAVPFGEIYTKSYLVNMAENISAACEGAHFSRREIDQLKLDAAFKTVELTPQAGLNNLMGAFLGIANALKNPTAYMEQGTRAEMDADALAEEAMKDAFALVTRHQCGSPDIDRFGRNLRSYITNEGAPRMSTDELFSKCVAEARPTGRYDAQNFCMCFTPLMSQAAVSRSMRKGLATDFWATAQKMIEKNPSHYGACIHGIN